MGEQPLPRHRCCHYRRETLTAAGSGWGMGGLRKKEGASHTSPWALPSSWVRGRRVMKVDGWGKEGMGWDSEMGGEQKAPWSARVAGRRVAIVALYWGLRDLKVSLKGSRCCALNRMQYAHRCRTCDCCTHSVRLIFSPLLTRCNVNFIKTIGKAK